MRFSLFRCGQKYYVPAILVATLSHPAQSQSLSADAVEGFYSSSSRECTKYDSKSDQFVSCEREFDDCVLLRKVDAHEVEVEIYSTQADQHVCALNGIAKIDGGALIYRFDEQGDGQRIEFLFKGKNLQLKQHVPEGQSIENCGAHATFDGVRVTLVDRKIAKHSCFKG